MDSLRRTGKGPFFIECMTYRLKEHVGPNDDYQFGYRKKAEAEPWMKGDPVKTLAERVPAAERAAIEREVEAQIKDAIEFAEKSPFPDLQELYTDVYAE